MPAPCRGPLATVAAFRAGCAVLLLAGIVAGSAQELLQDGGFELDQGNGTVPSSGFWRLAYLGEGGSIVVTNIGVSGNGLLVYTGAPTNDIWSAPYQDAPASPGAVFQGSALIRTPTGSTQWVAGTRARVHLAFLNTNTNVINSFESPALTNLSEAWQSFQVTTEAAPSETAFVRFMCLLEKPRGATNLSAAVFDNCSLQPGTFSGLEAWPRAVGVAANLSVATLNLQNTGNAPVTWRATNGPAWLGVTPNSGTLTQATLQTLNLTIDRSQLAGSNFVLGTLQILQGTNTIPIRLFIELPSPPVPAQPALVHADGWRLVVQDRLPDGSLAPAQNYTVRGVAWSPASRGTPDIVDVRRAEFTNWFVADIQLLRELNANTVYTYLDFGTNAAAFAVLDELYKYGLKALVTVDENGTGNTNTLLQTVTAYRQHPAILGWVIGNEWNINLYHGLFPTNGYLAAAAFTEQMAERVKQLDPNHVVVSTHGDIYPPEMSDLVNNLCPSVDVWGLNVYRGPSFTTLFQDWAAFSTKPMLLTEFGCDAYSTLMLNLTADGAIVSADGYVAEAVQADWERGLWREIAAHLSANSAQGVCLGGTVFEWADEWWKAQAEYGGEVGRHDNLGFYASWNPASLPDSTANEEWWGLVSVDRLPRLTYTFFQQDFVAVAASIQYAAGNSIALTWPARSNVVYDVSYHDGALANGAAFSPLVPWTNLTVSADGPFRLVATNQLVAPGRFYRVTAQPH